MKRILLIFGILLFLVTNNFYAQSGSSSEEIPLSTKTEANIIYDYLDLFFKIQLSEIEENIEALYNSQPTKGIYQNKNLKELLCIYGCIEEFMHSTMNTKRHYELYRDVYFEEDIPRICSEEYFKAMLLSTSSDACSCLNSEMLYEKIYELYQAQKNIPK